MTVHQLFGPDPEMVEIVIAVIESKESREEILETMCDAVASYATAMNPDQWERIFRASVAHLRRGLNDRNRV